MRQIEFKCLILDRNGKIVGTFYEWLDGDGWKHDYYAPLVSNGVFSYEELGDGFLGEIKRLQFTGLPDKNGKKIFEGDIVSDECNHGVVFFNEDEAQYQVDFSPIEDCPQEMTKEYNWALIIGNIHDNPELLNEQQ